MITEFKSREQLNEEGIIKLEEFYNKLLKEKPGIQTERYIRMLKGEMQGNDRLYISNSLVKLKRNLIKQYKNLDYCHSEKKEAKRIIESDALEEFKSESEAYIELLEGLISEIKDYIMECGEVILHAYIPLIDKYFSESEIVQLLSGSYEEAKEIKEFYNKHENDAGSLTDSFIINHVEYRWRKGRAKDFVDCPKWEMPLFNCVSNYIIDSIRKNPKLKAETDGKMEELFGDAMVCTTTDSQGNIIEAEKLFQNLTQNELIRDFQGSFINELKQKDIFDNQTIYKIKRVDHGVYSIIGEDKKEIAKIYKKIG